MEKLGQWIKAAREAKGISLLEAERVTKIRSKFLTALEEGNQELLPPRSYLKGMVRVYASYLGLDVEQAVRLLEESLDPETPYDIRQVATPIGKQTVITSRMIVGVVILAIVIASLIFLRQEYNQFVASNKISDLQSIANSNIPSLSSTKLTSSLTPSAQREAAPKETPTETPTPAPTPTPTPLQEITVEAKITDRTWLQVDVDGQTVLQQILLSGVTKSWTAKDHIKMRAGNAGGVEITFNGKRQGVMGAKGEVVDRTWTRP